MSDAPQLCLIFWGIRAIRPPLHGTRIALNLYNKTEEDTGNDEHRKSPIDRGDMKMHDAVRLAVGAMLLLAAGCAHYYKVSDPAGTKEYYTTDIDDTKSGAIKLKDEKTGAIVTLQSSEVKEISEEEYKAAIGGQPK